MSPALSDGDQHPFGLALIGLTAVLMAESFRVAWIPEQTDAGHDECVDSLSANSNSVCEYSYVDRPSFSQ